MIPPHELRKRSVQERLRWLLWCVLAPLVAIFAWIAVEDLSNLFGDSDLRLEASRAAAIAYGDVSKDGSGFHIVIAEMWKNAPAEYGQFVGKSIPSGNRDSAATPDGAVVFFRRAIWFNKRLEIRAVYFVNNGRVGSPDMSVSELKEICSASPSR